MRRSAKFVLGVIISCVAVSGCVQTTFKTKPNLVRETPELRVLLMPIDVELAELTAGGVTEPNAEWTAKAKKNLVASVSKTLSDNKSRLVGYKAPAGGSDTLHPHVQLIKLHQAVGSSILTHKFNPALALPNKENIFDWSLGDEVKRLREDFDADYAMFVFMRDSYASGGRAVAIVFAAVIGVGLQGGQQLGFASLVDLRSGELVWFNLLRRGSGDLRTEKDAAETVSVLLNDLPK